MGASALPGCAMNPTILLNYCQHATDLDVGAWVVAVLARQVDHRHAGNGSSIKP